MAVQFDEPSILPPKRPQKQTGGLLGLLMRLGLAKSEGDAKLMLVLVALIMLLAAAFFFFRSLPRVAPPEPIPEYPARASVFYA